MKIMNKYIIIFFVCLIFFTFPLKSENCFSEAFLVKNVSIDQSAASGQIARAEGTKIAENKSLIKIIKRMLLPGQPIDEGTFNLSGKDFLDFTHVYTEKALSKRYIAEVDFCFNPNLLREYFISRSLKWSELVSSNILILPIWQDPSGIRMWANNVLWLSTWKDFINKTDSLIKFKILKPSIALERFLSPDIVISRDKKAIELSAKAVGASQIIFLYAGIDYSKDVPYLSMISELYNSEGDLLTVINEEKYKIDGQLNLQLTFEDFQLSVKNLIETRWKERNLFDPNKKNEILVSLDIKNFKDLKAFQKYIESLPIVKNTYKMQLSSNSFLTKIVLVGSIEAFGFAIKDAGYDLINDQENYKIVLK